MIHERAFHLALIASLAGAPVGCSSGGDDGGRDDTGLEGLALTAVNPGTVVPGSLVVIEGSSFVGEPWGTSRLHLSGSFGGAAAEIDLPALFVDFDRMEIDADADFFAAFGADEGDFQGSATVQVDSPVDGLMHESEPIEVTLSLRQQLTPTLSGVDSGVVIFINDKIPLTATGLLMGGNEGTTVASLAGCFRVGEGECVDTGTVEVPVETEGWNRDDGTFAFAPTIAGIRPGSFEGTVLLINRHEAGAVTQSELANVAYTVSEPALYAVSPTAVSLGQFVDVEGGGFVGGEQGGVTLIELTGTFTPDGGGPMDVTLTLVPEFVEGRLVRYVLNEDDSLGRALDLRRITGTFSGEVTPVVQYEADEVVGAPTTFTLGIAPVKQVVYLVFEPSYVESLRHFGLRALDQQIRQRIIDVVTRDYRTVNLEVRLEEPTDFALYSVVEISGPDPNGIGLLGYDNSPGKDTGNKRLYDQVGGVNAVTQEDGSPGYGGVFIESLSAFSQHPGDHAAEVDQADGRFDDVFDHFRPDQDGRPVSSNDLAGGAPAALADGSGCPAGDRDGQIACAIFVLGSTIGTTLSHEIGHSLGLANPFGEGFHNNSDEPNRMMDNGGDRPFGERAELGEGPGDFCVTEYEYLRDILPTAEAEDPTVRPTCF
jgi:hypothetical protein